MDYLSGINTIRTNFKAEVVASSLVENGFDKESILIYRHKGNLKDVSKDIDKIEYRHPGLDDIMGRLYIYTNRESMYDSMPEGLFHQAAPARKQSSKEEIIRDIKVQRGKETSIRKFFKPFEMALDSVLVEAQSCELKYDKAHFYGNLSSVIKENWDILCHLDTGQALLFIKAIPILPEASRNLDLSAGIMSIILGCPVIIREGEKSRIMLEGGHHVKLGDWTLGVNSVLGDSVEYGSASLEIGVGPVDTAQLGLFKKDGGNDLILHELISLLLPFDRDTRIRYTTIPGENRFRLPDNSHTAYLGINTTL